MSPVLTEAAPMTKKRDDTSVKIDSAIYKMAKHVAAQRDIHLAEYLSDLLKKPVQRDYSKMVDEMHQKQQHPNGDLEE